MSKLSYLLLGVILILSACGQSTTHETKEDDDQSKQEQLEETKKEEAVQPEVDSKNETTGANQLNSISLYFSDEELMKIYQVEINQAFSNDEDGLKDAIQLWVNGPTHPGLESLIPNTVNVQSVQFIDDVAYISFSNELTDAVLGSTGEYFVIQQLVMMAEQFGFDRIFILIDGEERETLFGHVEINEPKIREIASEEVELIN